MYRLHERLKPMLAVKRSSSLFQVVGRVSLWESPDLPFAFRDAVSLRSQH